MRHLGYLVPGVMTALAVAACQGNPDAVLQMWVVRADELTPFPVEVTFSEVREITVTEQAIWILDRHPPYVTSVSRDGGSTVVQFGHGGDGPAELRHPVAFDPSEDGLDVWDVQLAKRVRYAADGSLEHVERFSADRSGQIRRDMDRVSHLDPWRIRRLGDDWIYMRLPDGMNRPIEYGQGSLVAVDRNLGSPSPLLDIADQVPRDERSQGQFPAMPLWDGCSSGLVVWNPRLAQIEWRDIHGVLTRTRTVPSEGVEITLDGIEQFLQAMARLELGPGAANVDVRVRAEEVRGAVGRVGTPFVDLRCESEGRAWLRDFELETDALGAGATWLVLDPSGAMTRIRFPSSFEPYAFTASAVLGVVRTAQGERLTSWRRSNSTTQ